jgi:Integrase core domain
LPCHAWTNGPVERLQGTILHAHWRIEFRRQHFMSRRAMPCSVDGFMRFYNERRRHHGYRLRGRTPARLFVGVL